MQRYFPQSLIKNMKASDESHKNVWDPFSSFLQRFVKGGAAFLCVPGGSVGCGVASDSVEKITSKVQGWQDRAEQSCCH